MPKAPKKFKTVLAGTRPQPRQQQQQQQSKQTAQRPPKHSKKPRNAPGERRSSKSAVHSHSARRGQWECASIIDEQSAEVLGKLLLAAETRRGGATIKSLTLAPHIVHKKPTFAVTCETLKHLPLLKQLVDDVGLLQQHEQQLSPAAAYVLAYEVLFGQGFRRKGPAEKAVLRLKDRLQSSLQGLLQDAGVQDAAAWLQLSQPDQQQQQTPAAPHPRHARVNLLKASVQQVLAQLKKEADVTAASNNNSSSSYSVEVDELLPDLLVFPPGTDLHDHPLVTEGVLVLQSKASCMPAHALQPGPGWHVVDCCAAPGNKTTHAAALLHANTLAAAAADCGDGALAQTATQEAAAGSSSRSNRKKRSRQESCAGNAQDMGSSGAGSIRVFAFDKDPKRLKRLATNVDRAGAGSIVLAQQADFLSIDPLDSQYAQVKGVILDPSCSGSGTVVSRMDHLLPGTTSGSTVDEQEQQRVEQLAKFQEAALLHALKFPALQRLVYSTCSIHQRENEDVVAAVLPAASAAGFRLVDPFPSWHRRGLPVLAGSELLVRTDAHEDGTDGFFVAVLERCGRAAPGPAGTVEQQQDEEGVEGSAPKQIKANRKKKKQQHAEG